MSIQDAPPEPLAARRSGASPLGAMSVDVEDWFQVGAFEDVIARGDWGALDHRVEANCDAVLALFAQHRVSATFFVLGWVAERFPALLRRIADAGHEVASHGYDHQRVFNLDPRAFADDLKRSRALIEDASGQRVAGYRAPSFSIDRRTPWAHEILAEHGYTYSSSVAPIRHDHYGWADSPRFAWAPVQGSLLIELPVTTVRLFGRNWAAGGGGFFRLLPYAAYHAAIARMHRRDGRGAIFYFHPWEIDPGQPRVEAASIKSKLRHYTKLKRMRGKLDRLLGDQAFGRMDEFAAIERELLR